MLDRSSVRQIKCLSNLCTHTLWEPSKTRSRPGHSTSYIYINWLFQCSYCRFGSHPIVWKKELPFLSSGFDQKTLGFGLLVFSKLGFGHFTNSLLKIFSTRNVRTGSVPKFQMWIQVTSFLSKVDLANSCWEIHLRARADLVLYVPCLATPKMCLWIRLHVCFCMY